MKKNQTYYKKLSKIQREKNLFRDKQQEQEVLERSRKMVNDFRERMFGTR